MVDYKSETTKLSRGLGVDLIETEKLFDNVPLALEGSNHATVRRKMAIDIRQHSNLSLQKFKDFSRENITTSFALKNTFNIVSEVFSPCVLRLMADLSQVCLPPYSSEASPSQLFDKTLSVNRRKMVNEKIKAIRENAKIDLPDDSAEMRAAMAVIGTDSLLASITGSFVYEIERNARRRMSEIVWSQKIPITAVPYVERVAKRSIRLCDAHIKKDQRVRLYLDSFESGGDDGYDHYFGSGRHVCLGKAISQQVWRELTTALSATGKRAAIKAVSYRSSDYVFNFPNIVEVAVTDD